MHKLPQCLDPFFYLSVWLSDENGLFRDGIDPQIVHCQIRKSEFAIRSSQEMQIFYPSQIEAFADRENLQGKWIYELEKCIFSRFIFCQIEGHEAIWRTLPALTLFKKHSLKLMPF